MTTETDTTPARGFPGVRCLHCNEIDTCVVYLKTLMIRCTSCEAEDTLQEIESLMDRWHRVLDWLHMAPLAD